MKWKDVKLGLKGIPMPGDECNELAFLALIARRTENQEVLAKLSTHRLWWIRKWVARRIEDQEILWKMYSAEHTNGDSSDAVIEWVARRIKDQDRLWSMASTRTGYNAGMTWVARRIKDQDRLWSMVSTVSGYNDGMTDEIVASRIEDQDRLWSMYSDGCYPNVCLAIAKRIKDQDRLWSMRNYEAERVKAMVVKRIKDEGRLWQYMIASTFSWCMANQYVRRLSPDSLWRYFSNTIMANSSDGTRESTACIVYIVNNVHDQDKILDVYSIYARADASYKTRMRLIELAPMVFTSRHHIEAAAVLIGDYYNASLKSKLLEKDEDVI